MKRILPQQKSSVFHSSKAFISVVICIITVIFSYEIERQAHCLLIDLVYYLSVFFDYFYVFGYSIYIHDFN